jgi:uncharacterized protein (UPF0332 family)
MAKHYQELLRTARHLLIRPPGQPGKLPNARIRRSISTSYYALFHFLLEEAGKRLIGSHNDLSARRRIFIRTFTHAVIKTTLDKVRSHNIDPAMADFLRQPGAMTGPVASPAFAQNMARRFYDAQTKRHDADYDLNKALSEADASLLIWETERAIIGWLRANTAADRDSKHALCMLMLLKGQLRREI